MIYVIGDTHGELERFKEKPLRRLSKKDTLVVLGDFGFLWTGDKQEQKNLRWLQKRRYQLLFLDGCHENFDLLAQYPEVDYKGGKARHLGGNLYYIQRGSVLQVDATTLLCFGGAESWDKEDRDEGINWWRQELPTSEELERCVRQLEAHDWKVDYILTHDAPRKILEFAQLMKGQPNLLHTFFDEVMEKTGYKKWLFGRYHKDRSLGTKSQMVFCQSVALDGGEAKPE